MLVRKKIVLLGGSGFVGSVLASVLSKNGHIVTVVSRKPVKEKLVGVLYENLDLVTESAKLKNLLNTVEVAVILWRPDGSTLKKCLPQLLESPHLKRVVYLSSLLLYSDSGNKHKEEDLIEPVSEYEKNKAVEEEMIKEALSKGAMELVIARLGNLYGNIMDYGLISLIMKALVMNQTLTVYGDGEQKRDYIHVEDCAMFLSHLCSLEETKTLDIFNVCTGEAFTVNRLIEMSEKVAGRQVLSERVLARQEKYSILGDNSKILKASGLKLKYDVASGLESTYKLFKTTYRII